MRAGPAIALLVAIASACGVGDPSGTTAPSVSSPSPSTSPPTSPPLATPATTPPTTTGDTPAPMPLGWTLVDTIDGVVAPGDTGVFVAANDAQWEAIWLGVGYPGDRPSVDFGRDIAVVWTYGVSGSCDEDSLDDVVVVEGVITPVFSTPYEPETTCTADYNPRARIVAIERASLPEVPFEVQIEAGSCRGCSVSVADIGESAPAVIPMTAEDLAQIIVAAVELRAAIVDADPAVPIEIVDTLAVAGGSEPVGLRDGTPLDAAVRSRLVDHFAPREVRFVASSVATEDREDTTPFAVIAVAEPSVVEGVLAVESSVWCGTLCFSSGANALLVSDVRAWSVGDPVGVQTVA